MDYYTADSIVEAYEELRSKCYRAVQSDPALMGEDAWLWAAMREHEMELYPATGYITISGITYTAQTMGFEHFSFDIPYDRLED